MNKEIRTILETPFTADQIKQRKGLWGKTLDYIEGHSVVQRLNDAFESDWTFTVVEYRILDDEVVVLGRVSVGDVTKEQFGGSNITRDSNSGKTLCLADDLKSAATDAMKKCATLLGVGLDLYGTTPTPAKGKPSERNTPATTPPAKPSNGNGNNGNNGKEDHTPDPANLITPKQKKFCLTLGRCINLTETDINSRCVKTFNTPFDQLTRKQASELIDSLSA